MLFGRPGRSASRQPCRFRRGPADGWPGRPPYWKFENFKNQSIAVTALVPSRYFWDIKRLSNDFRYFSHPWGFWGLFWTISNVFDTIHHIWVFFHFFDHFYWFLEFISCLQAVFLFWAISINFWSFLPPFGLFQAYFGPYLSLVFWQFLLPFRPNLGLFYRFLG